MGYYNRCEQKREVQNEQTVYDFNPRGDICAG